MAAPVTPAGYGNWYNKKPKINAYNKRSINESPLFNKREYNNNVNRMLLERGDWFGHRDESHQFKTNNTFSKDPNVGEITGK